MLSRRVAWRVAQVCPITKLGPHLRDGLIVAKVGIRATREPSFPPLAITFSSNLMQLSVLVE
jgi:hypothetical protein